MKKTYNINLAGVPFIIDDDAYTLLNDYLDTLAHTFRNIEDSQDILNDIESRFAELLLEQTTSSTIVTAEMVKSVMTRIGSPEEMIEEDEKITISEDSEEIVEEEIRVNATPPPYRESVPFIKKRLFRDPQNAILGGVCSGIGWYLGIDATWVRLIMVILTLVSFSGFCIAYIVLWIVVPSAKTPAQRMEMMGEKPTMENIVKTVTNNYEEVQNNSTGGFTYMNNDKTPVLVKILTIVGLIIGLPILLAMCLGILGCIFFLIIVIVNTSTGTLESWLGEDYSVGIAGVIAAVFVMITFIIPIGILVWKGLANDSAQKFTKRNRNLLLYLWLTSFMCSAVSVGICIHMDSVSEERHRREYREAVRTERLSGWEEVKETTDDSIFLQEIVTESSSDTVAVDTLVITSAQSANS